MVIKNGGVKLDIFDSYLSMAYAKYGFIPVTKVKFNREFAPDNWNYGRWDGVLTSKKSILI